jgi:hypothetical protein
MSDAIEQTIPLIILGGGAKEAEVVEGGPDSPRLKGLKGATVRLGGRLLIDIVIERFRSCGFFDPIFIAGPVAAYGESREGAEVIDTDADFGGNIRAGYEAVKPRLDGSPLAFTTCDVIPEPADLELLVRDYREHAPLDFWYPAARVPEDESLLGASAGKRRYRMRLDREGEMVAILPGHIVVVDPRCARADLLYSAFEFAYRSRTRPVFYRFLYITSRTLLRLLRYDLQGLLRLRLPLMTMGVLWNAMWLSHLLGTGTGTQSEVAGRLRRLFTTRSHRRRYPDRKGRVPILDVLSLAKDIDTQREAEEIGLEA